MTSGAQLELLREPPMRVDVSPDGRGTALFSHDGVHRYLLGRRWGEPNDPAMLVIGLNPSRATATIPDMTLTKSVGFARRFGARGGVILANLFTRIATDPRDLWAAQRADRVVADAQGDVLLERLLADRHIVVVVAAWGELATPAARQRADVVTKMVLRHGELHCLGLTKEGAPRHPSRLGYGGVRLEVFSRRSPEAPAPVRAAHYNARHLSDPATAAEAGPCFDPAHRRWCPDARGRGVLVSYCDGERATDGPV